MSSLWKEKEIEWIRSSLWMQLNRSVGYNNNITLFRWEINSCKGRFDTKDTHTRQSNICKASILSLTINTCVLQAQNLTHTHTHSSTGNERQWVIEKAPNEFPLQQKTTKHVYIYTACAFIRIKCGKRTNGDNKNDDEENPKQRKGGFGRVFLVLTFNLFLYYSMTHIWIVCFSCCPWFVCVCVHVFFCFL